MLFQELSSQVHPARRLHRPGMGRLRALRRWHVRNHCWGLTATARWRCLPRPRERAKPFQSLPRPALPDRLSGHGTDLLHLVV
eukprot:14194195-Alexandrium_andersonii.AAC.1